MGREEPERSHAEAEPPAAREKARSLGTAPLSRRARAELAALDRDRTVRRLRVLQPRTRGDCKGGPRPCPWVSCSMHLAFDVMPESGALKENFPGIRRLELAEPWPRKPKMVWVKPRRGGARGRYEYLTFAGPPRQHEVYDLALLEETCALDVADRGRHDLARVGQLMGNLTMQAISLIEQDALDDARAFGEAEGWAEDVSEARARRVHQASTRIRQNLEDRDFSPPPGW